jgi:hypothetical protein
MLVICQDPDNPGVKRSGELSFTNDDPSANMLRGTFKYLDLNSGASRSPGMPSPGPRWARRTMT